MRLNFPFRKEYSHMPHAVQTGPTDHAELSYHTNGFICYEVVEVHELLDRYTCTALTTKHISVRKQADPDIVEASVHNFFCGAE